MRITTENSGILRVRRGAIWAPGSFSLLLVFRHGPKGVWELGITSKKENLPSFLDALAHPQSLGNTPRGSSKCPAAWHGEQQKKTWGVFKQRPPRISCVMWGSRFTQETRVSTEGTGGSSGTSGSQMAKVQLPFTGTGCAQRRHSWLLYCTASIRREHAGMITESKCIKITYRAKMPSMSRISYVRLVCVSVFYRTDYFIFWGFGLGVDWHGFFLGLIPIIRRSLKTDIWNRYSYKLFFFYS